MRFQHLVSTPATTATCRRCRRPILVGLDGGLPVRADAVPVTADAELVALVAGRWTFTLQADRSLARRTSAVADDCAVYAEHACSRRAR